MGRGSLFGLVDVDDFIYVLVLIVSVPFGAFVKGTVDPLRRRVICCSAGCLIVAVVCKLDGLHSLFTAIVNCIIVTRLKPNICHYVSFVWSFGYLVFFRTTSYFSLPQVIPHANAVQLLLTLKMVGLGFEVHDSWKISQQEEQQNEERDSSRSSRRPDRQNFTRPSFADGLMYSFCYIGILTGPYYKFKTYEDMIHNRNANEIETSSFLKERLKWIPVLVAGYLTASAFFSIQHVRSDEFYEHTFLLYRVFYMFPMFAIFRMRFYIAWLLSECICISAALGAYPATSQAKCGQGPTVFDRVENRDERSTSLVLYDFETVHNIDIYGCELAPTVRAGMKSWNMTVQYWLASNVFRRISRRYNFMRVAATMIVSAFWHGIHPGYYLSFLTIPLNLCAEDAMIAAFRKGASTRQIYVFDWCCWFFKMRCFEYMCMGFLLLSLNDTIRYWRSIYFIWHIVIVVFIVIGFTARRHNRGETVNKNE